MNANKALFNEFIERVWNRKELERLDDYFAPDFIDHSAPPGQDTGIEGARQVFGMFLDAFPDCHINVEFLIAEGDLLVARDNFRGTHRQSFMGIAPTGN